MSVSLRTITGGILTATEHAMMNFGAFPHDGFLNPTVNIQIEGSSIHFNDDIYGLIAGRMFRITDETFSFVLPISGTLAGTIYLKLDLDNVDSPLQLLSTTDTPPAETTFESGVVNFDSEEVIKYLCTFTVTPTAITDLAVAFPVGIWGFVNSPNFPTLPISKGGTGATTAAAARNALGLGNTTGALPIANGGTGKTNAADAIKALSGYTLDLGTLNSNDTWVPVLNNDIIQHRAIPAAYNSIPLAVGSGGTGATTATNARKNLYAAGTTNEGEIAPFSNGQNNQIFMIKAANKYSPNAVKAGNASADANTWLVVRSDGLNIWDTGGLGAKWDLSFPIAVGKGGTGATSAANARTNLGITCPKLWTGTLNTVNNQISFTFGGYLAYIINGTASGTSYETIIIPANDIRTGHAVYLISDEASYLKFEVWYSGSTGYVKLTERSSNLGVISNVWGMN